MAVDCKGDRWSCSPGHVQVLWGGFSKDQGSEGHGCLGVKELNSLGDKGKRCSSPLCPAAWAAKPASLGKPLKCREQDMGSCKILMADLNVCYSHRVEQPVSHPRISSALEANFRMLSKILPRYNNLSIISTGFPWMVELTAAASSLCLLEKVTTISLVLFTWNSRQALSHHSTNLWRAGLWCCEEPDSRGGLCHQRTLPCRNSAGWTCTHQNRKWRAGVIEHRPAGNQLKCVGCRRKCY